jgi:signal transduction histidine kinase
MKVVVLDGPMAGREFRITKRALAIGRKEDADVYLDADPRISRLHCRLVYESGRYWVEDTGSANGTFLHNRRVTEKVHWPTEVIVRVGRTHLTLREESEADLQAEAERAVSIVAEEPDGQRMEVSQTLDPQALHAQWAVAPDSAELVEKLQHRLDVLHQVADTLSGQLDRGALLRAIMDSVMRAVPADRGFLMLVDEEAKRLTAKVVRTQTDLQPAERISIPRAIALKTINERVSILSADAMADEELRASQSVMDLRIRSAMCIPMIYRDDVLGLIYLDTTTAAHVFTDEELELVTDIARQSAIALSNMDLYTDLRTAYDELHTAQERLVRSEKLSIIGTLSASVAHDIGNVITPISTIVELAVMRDDIEPDLRETVERQTQRLRALTHQLLSFSRPQDVQKEAVDIEAALEATLDLVRTEARRSKVRIERRLSEDLPPILADPNQLEQVFVNLILNAVNAMEPDGGELVIAGGREDGTIEIQFRDTGPGIPAEHMPRLFEPFFTTKGDGGTGLGLFSCKRIIEEEHGGEIAVESELGEGTTFVVRLPAAPEDDDSGSEE